MYFTRPIQCGSTVVISRMRDVLSFVPIRSGRLPVPSNRVLTAVISEGFRVRLCGSLLDRHVIPEQGRPQRTLLVGRLATDIAFVQRKRIEN